MKHLSAPLIRSALLLGAFMLGHVDITRASSHHEAPLIADTPTIDAIDTYVFLPSPNNPNQSSLSGSIDVEPNHAIIGANKLEIPNLMEGSNSTSHNSLSPPTASPLSQAVVTNSSPFPPIGITKNQIRMATPVDRDSQSKSADSLQIESFFSSIQDGRVISPQGFQAGDTIQLIVNGTKKLESLSQSSHVPLILVDASDSQKIQVMGALSDDVGAGIVENRQVGEFKLPYDLAKGFYDVFLEMGENSSPVAQIEISDSVSQNRRRELVQIIQTAMNHQYESPYTMIGPYSPLPMGARIQDFNSGELVSLIDQDNTWLFFAYDPTSFFGQSDARWILVDADSEMMRIIENREFWPDVLLSNGEPYPFQYGNRDHFVQKVFTTGNEIYFLDEESGPNFNAPTASQLAANAGRAIIGVPLKNGCDPKKVKKYAIFITFNDIEEQFKQLLNEEKDLVKKLGFDGTAELFPKDFLPHREKAYGANKVSLEALKKAVLDILKKEEKNTCCVEIVLFINAHQNSMNAVKIQHRFTHKKNEKDIPKTINTHINNGKLVEFISQILKDETRTCIPTAIVFHSCNSGKFDADGFSKAFKANPNLRVYASSSENQKTSGDPNGEEFFFIEGLKILLTPPKTFEQNWEEILEETQNTWLDYQVEWCFKQVMMEMFGENWREAYRNTWNKETFEQQQKAIKAECRKKLKKIAQKPKRVGPRKP